jgi:hypothetical protein
MLLQALPLCRWFAFQGVRVELGHVHQPMDDWRYVNDSLPPLQAKTRPPPRPPAGTPI